MKRKLTELEKKLIENGWYLESKTYYGKHSDKVLNYIYRKTYEKKYVVSEDNTIVTCDVFETVLNRERTHVDDIRMFIKAPKVDVAGLMFLISRISEVEKEVKSYLDKEEDKND